MTPEVKERIQLIKQGKVPKGYKKVGEYIIPEKWSIKTFQELCSGFDYGMNSSAKDYDGKNKYIRITDIDDISHKFKKENLVTPKNELEKMYMVNKDDILFARTGSTVGKTYIYDENDGNLYFAGFLIRMHVTNDNSYYIYSQTLMPTYKRWVKVMSKRSGQPGINAEEYKKVKVCWCEIDEQQKIADILSTQDKVIELKEKLLEEKKKQKKYIMQKLIQSNNSQKNNTTFARLGTLISQKSERNKQCLVSNVLSINNHAGFISQSEQFGKTVASSDLSNYKIVEFNNIAYNPSRINVGSIAIYKSLDKGIVSPMYTVFKTEKGLMSDYFMYMMQTNYMEQKIKTLLSGSVRESLNFDDLCSVCIFLPDLQAQKKIVGIISTADKEIELITKDLQQERLKKKALMQLLLTGIVRV